MDYSWISSDTSLVLVWSSCGTSVKDSALKAAASRGLVIKKSTHLGALISGQRNEQPEKDMRKM
jgi:hypothetical protein